MTTDDERALIAGVMIGDRAAFDRLAGRHWDDLWRYAYRFARRADLADDLVQDALFAMWLKRERLDVQQGVRGFLFGVVRKRFLEIHRHNKIVHRIEQAHHPTEVSGASALVPLPGMVVDTDLLPALVQFMAALPDQRREVLLLRWWHGLRYEEIAEATGMGLSAVKMLVRRSAERLRELLGPNNGHSERTA